MSCQNLTSLYNEMYNMQLDATQLFIAHVISSTCLGHVYPHHQELATIMLVWHVACNSWLLVVGRSGAGSRLCVRDEGCCAVTVLYCTCNQLNMFRARLYPSSGARDLMLVWHVACSSWLLVVGGSGAEQQAMRPE